MVLLRKSVGGDLVPVIRAAILGSILANLLLCLGFCFFVGGMRTGREELHFSDVISEVGSGLLLMAGFALLIPRWVALDSCLIDPSLAILPSKDEINFRRLNPCVTQTAAAYEDNLIC